MIVDCSSTFLKTFGYSHVKEIIGMGADLFATDPFHAQIRDRLEKEERAPFKFMALRKDQSTFLLEVTGKTFSYLGKLVRVASIRDLSSNLATLQE